MKAQQAATLLLEETLFQVDLRAEQLKSYLEKVTNTVNGHSSYLNNLQIQLNQVLKLQDYEAYLQRTAKSMSLRDPEFEQQISFQLEKPLAENGSDQIENAICMVINKERVFSQGMAYLFKRSKDWEAKLNKLEADLAKRALKDDLEKGLKEQKTKLSDQIEDLNKKLTKRFQDQERSATQNQNQLQQSINELEKKTLWKISDCEKLLQQRINDKFVESSCQGVYDRVMRDIAKQKDEGIKGIQNEMAELKAKFQYNDERNQDNFKTLRIQLKEMNDTISQKYTPLEKFEQTKQILSDRTVELQNKVGELSRKMDAILQLEKLIPQIKSMDDKIADCQYRGEQNRKDIEELKIKTENFDGQAKGGKSDIDPHKVCSLEADIKRLKSDYTDQENKLRLLENELKRKIDVNEQRFLQQLNLLKQAPQQQQLSKEDIISIIDKEISQPMSLLRARILQIVGQACGENMSFEMFIRNLLNDIADMKKKMEGLQDLDKKMRKYMKQMTSNDNTDLQRQLAEKANEEDTKAKFTALEEKYKTMAENYGILAKGMKELEEFSNYLQTLLYVNQQETVSILTGNHRVVTQRCLVCSGKTKLTKTVDKSQDLNQAKLVRGDLRPKDLVYENSEVYELNPNQVNYTSDNQKYVGTTVGFKYPMLNQNKASNQDDPSSSSGRIARPQSAQQKKY
ncbi:unnamed protein product (macronuclear) [Paramecium tetraurelia]|uniref:Uncharacterized protein n=1 Tax=Paramecium tetraurelia TaxID=5888 RepID=A0E2K8_PARTE|nr:uncharacterized protein GSPATT00022697001 [Paramecium tetraurelia]CAK89525.1 unnamed protein product [Paramecium tetraurelia]|eukprot:XP_001456922.1 hypothetical protein (macronuclear) [Paramecium tetraurelia strain d4-2]